MTTGSPSISISIISTSTMTTIPAEESLANVDVSAVDD